MTTEGNAEAGAGTPAEVLRFGAFEMDLRASELRKAGALVRLQPQPFRLLALLVARPGQVVTREEIREELWPEGTFVAFEQSVNFSIRQIRLVLNDSAVTPRFIETLPRRGYRWVGGPVERIPVGADQTGGARGETDGGDGDPLRAPPTAPAPGIPAWVRSLGAALALAALPLIVYSLVRRPAPSASEHFRRTTFQRGFVTSARFGPRGQVVYAASWDGRPVALYESRPDSSDARAVGLAAFRLAGVSAAGEVAFIQDGTLARAPLAGGPPREVATAIQAADWRADGSTFAVARVLEDGFRLEYPVGQPLGELPGVGDLRISPDGQHLAFSQRPTFADDRGFVVIVDRGGRRVATSETFGSLDGLAWSPRGDEVWFTAVSVGVKNALRALALDGRERLLLGAMGRLVLHDVAPDGRLLISRSTHRAEILFQRAGEPDPVDLSWLDVSAVAALSPDGATMLFYEGGEGAGPDYTTYLRRTDGSPPVRLGEGRAFDLSPDGQWALVILVTRPDHVRLVPTAAGETRELRGPETLVSYDAAGWLPGGETLFVTGRDEDGQRSTWILDRQGRHPRRLPLPKGRFLSWSTFSPDSRTFVAGCPFPDGRPCLYDAIEGSPRPLPGAAPGWEAIGWDDRGRVFFRDRPGVGHPVTLRRLDPTTGSVEEVAQLIPPDRDGLLSIYRAFVTPDARAWLYNAIRRQSDLFVATGVD